MSRPAHSSTGRSDELQPGQIIAERYRVEGPIGTGGNSIIWQATHLTLHRPIALKFIDLQTPNTAKSRQRFLREARVAAAVVHRNVVDILDFGTTEDGRPFMAMELLVGSTLAQRLARGPGLTVAESVGIVARILSGLAAVHEAGIVHRDLKPENVFLVDDKEGGVYPKLLDFGVSRSVDPQGRLESVLPTIENAIVGTPQYMSPEQARGLPDLDHRSDLWSTGVILFELMTGTLPFDSDAVGDVIIQIATAAPPDFAALRPDLAGPLAAVVKKAMSRERDRRFQSAREMRAALLQAAAQTAAELAPPTLQRGPEREIGTISEIPEHEKAALLSAVDRAYEPGDSAIMGLGQIEELESAIHRVSRPPPPPVASEPPLRRRTWPLALLGGAIVAASTVGGFLAVQYGTSRAPDRLPPPISTAGAPQPMPVLAPSVRADEVPVEQAAEPVPMAQPTPVSAPVARPRRASGLLREPGF